MSPEQARGKTVDRRADIWAFGVVLYEMLTGEQLFQGETISDTLAAVLTKQPDWGRAPVKARRLLQRCLEKDPKKRLRDIGDTVLLVQDEAPPQIPAARSLWPWVVAGLFAAVAGLALWAPWRAGPKPQPLVRLNVDLGSEASLESLRGAAAILSPDGTRLVYCSRSRLFTRRLDQAKATELVGTEGAWSPFFSPDGQWVGFFTAGKLKKVPVEGGAAFPLCNAGFGYGGSWGQDGSIVAALTGFGVLSRIPNAGGTPKPVTELAPGENAHRWPQILPGGRAVLFTALTTAGLDATNIDVVSLGDPRPKILQRGARYGRYLPSGHLIYVHDGTLFAVRFDPDRLEVRGTPVAVLDGVSYSDRYASAQFDFSQAGTLVYRSGTGGENLSVLEWLDGAGHATPLPVKPSEYQTPRLSPDGRRLALSTAGDVWVYDLQRETMTRLSPDANQSGYPVWSPDGRFILFRGEGGMYWIRSDGSGASQPLTRSSNLQFPTAISADGKWFSFSELNQGGVLNIWTMPLEIGSEGLRGGKPQVFLKSSADFRSARFSPDGRWLAYSSNESGTDQVYVQAFPAKGGKTQISADGGMSPFFSPNGRALFFRNPDNQVMVAEYTVARNSFVAAKPRLWSERRLMDYGALSNYDVAPDGKRIVALLTVEGPEADKARNHVTFLLNFFDELRRKVPVK